MSVNNWKQKGNIYLWRYAGNPKNYSGWHLTGDNEGVESLLELLGLMLEENSGSNRTFRLSKPGMDITSVVGCRDRMIAESKVKFCYEVSEATELNINPNSDDFEIVINRNSTNHLIFGLKDVKNGKGDYSTGQKQNKLWFWWAPHA